MLFRSYLGVCSESMREKVSSGLLYSISFSQWRMEQGGKNVADIVEPAVNFIYLYNALPWFRAFTLTLPSARTTPTFEDTHPMGEEEEDLVFLCVRAEMETEPGSRVVCGGRTEEEAGLP